MNKKIINLDFTRILTEANLNESRSCYDGVERSDSSSGNIVEIQVQ